jgi:hypothetical protein
VGGVVIPIALKDGIPFLIVKNTNSRCNDLLTPLFGFSYNGESAPQTEENCVYLQNSKKLNNEKNRIDRNGERPH